MIHRWLTVIGLALAVVLVVSRARAAEPVIEEGREKDVLALFSPHSLGQEVVPSYRLWAVQIRPTHIDVGVRGPAGEEDSIRLLHPSRAPHDAERTKSFGVVRSPRTREGPSAAAADALVKALVANDRGGFWAVERELPGAGKAALVTPLAWLKDGVVLFGLFALLVGALVWRCCRGEPRAVVRSLVVISAVGIVLRLALAPDTVLGAWPYSRLYPHVRLAFEGPSLALLSKLLDAPIYLTDVTRWFTFGYAALAPAAVFAAAMSLFRDWRLALSAAAIIALLPQHIRFSVAEDGGLPSVTLAAVAVALVRVCLTETSRFWSVSSAFVLTPLLVALFGLRPLNNIYALLLVALPFLERGSASRERRVGAGVLLAVLSIYGVWQMSAEHGQGVREGLSISLIAAAMRAFFSFELNTLLNPSVTPLPLVAVAVVGAVRLWRSGKRALVLWLVVWMAAFFIAHSIVQLASMAPRYHLPLTIPLALLAASGLWALRDWKRPVFFFAAAYVIASPLLHSSFIRDVAYTDMLEFAFVRNARDRIPAGCHVFEYTGSHEDDARFRRIGMHLKNGEIQNRYAMRVIGGSEARETVDRGLVDELKTRSVCTYVYEGLPCWGTKAVGEPIAKACKTLRDAAPLETIESASLPVRPYDSSILQGVDPGVDRVRISLYRVQGSPEPKAQPEDFAPVARARQAMRRIVTLVVAAFALGAAFWELRRRFQWRRPRRDLLVLVGLVAAVGVVALVVPERLPTHEHNSFLARMDCAHEGSCDSDPRAPGWLPPVFHVYGAVLKWFPYRLSTLGLVSLGFALTSLVLSFALARSLFEHFELGEMGSRVGLLMVAFLALEPTWLRIAVSDTFWPYSLCCLLAAGLLLLAALRSGRFVPLFAAGAFFALGVLGNMVFLSLLPLALLAPLCWQRQRGVFGPRRSLAVLVALLVFVLPYAMHAYKSAFVTGGGALTGRASGAAALVRSLWNGWDIHFFDLRLSPAPLALYLMVGAVAAVRFWRVALPFVYAYVATAPFLSNWGGDPVGISYPVGFINAFPTLYFLSFLAACGASALIERLAARYRLLASAGAVGLALVSLPFAREGVAFLRGGRVLERELVALSAAFDVLPPHDVLVEGQALQPVLAGAVSEGDPIEVFYPGGEHAYVLRRRGYLAAPIVTIDQFLERGARPGERVLLYVGSKLRSFQPSEMRAGVVPPDLERPALTEIRRRYTLDPVHEFEIESAQHPAINLRLGADRVPRVKLGFYWLRPRHAS